MYYIDGCSYTAGHSKRDSWTSVFNPQIPIIPGEEVKGYSNLYKPDFYEGINFEYPVINCSRVAKSNEAIFLDFMEYRKHLDSSWKVIIFWTHSERYVYGVDQASNEKRTAYYRDVKNFSVIGNPDWLNAMIGYAPAKDGSTLINILESYVIKTMSYMLLVQEWCEANNVEYYFITTDPYSKFMEVADKYDHVTFFKDINYNRIFNWPAPFYQEIPEDVVKRNWDYYVMKWSACCFVTAWARAMTVMTGKEIISTDKKHISHDYQHLLGEQIKRWVEDPRKDLEWIINNEWSHDASLHFSSLAHSMRLYKVGVHWVEQQVQEYLEASKKLAEFIYEDK